MSGEPRVTEREFAEMTEVYAEHYRRMTKEALVSILARRAASETKRNWLE